MENIPVVPDEGQLSKIVNPIVTKANEIIVNEATVQLAVGHMNNGLAAQKRIVELFKPAKQSANKTHSDICTLEALALTPLRASDNIIKYKLGVYRAEQEKIDQEKAAKAAKKIKADKEAERLRLAELAEVAGENEMAEQIVDEPIDVPVSVSPAASKINGVSFRERWKAEVTDKAMLLRAVVDGHVPLAAIEINQTFLNQQAGSLKTEMKYPGVRVYPKKSTVGRAS